MENCELRTRSATTTAGRPRSVRIDIRTIYKDDETETQYVTREEILKSLYDKEIKKEELQGIEIQSKHTVYAVFNSYGDRNKHLNKRIMLRETSLHLEHPNPSFERKSKTLVRIYNYPIDGELKDLETVLKQYGRFINITPVHDHYGLATGEKTTVMDIKKDIPSFLYVGKHQV